MGWLAWGGIFDLFYSASADGASLRKEMKNLSEQREESGNERIVNECRDFCSFGISTDILLARRVHVE